MKRKATSPIFADAVETKKSAKNPRVESQVFQQALKDEGGIQYPDMENLKRCKLSELKSICLRCNLPVSKTGGVKRPASVKLDYVNAILLHVVYLQIPPTESWDGMLVDEPRSNVNYPRSENHPLVPELGEKAANCLVKVRLFQSPGDYRTEYKAEVLYAYHSGERIRLRNLATELSLDELDVIHPKSYKPLLITLDETLDSNLIPMLLGTQGFLRVTESSRPRKT